MSCSGNTRSKAPEPFPITAWGDSAPLWLKCLKRTWSGRTLTPTSLPFNEWVLEEVEEVQTEWGPVTYRKLWWRAPPLPFFLKNNCHFTKVIIKHTAKPKVVKELKDKLAHLGVHAILRVSFISKVWRIHHASIQKYSKYCTMLQICAKM